MNKHAESQEGMLSEMVGALPALPSSLRYYDDFEDKFRSIKAPASLDSWPIESDGSTSSIHFSLVGEEIRPLFKHLAADLLARLDPLNSANTCNALLNQPRDFLRAALLTPHEFREIWISEIKPQATPDYALRLRTAVHSLCNLSFGEWMPELHSYVGRLESPPVDIYKTVRTGECFLPLSHQSLLIDHLDSLASTVLNSVATVTDKNIRDACILVISHQYGFRPGQIARIRMADVRRFDTGAIHISVALLKQRGEKALRTVVRRIKRDWSPIFVEYIRRRGELPYKKRVHKDSFFNLTPQGLSQVIRNAMEGITGTPWTSMELRHTAAQRLADAGVSHLSLSEFMGHATTLTANVYFDASPAQAKRINQALALSPIYSKIAEVARTKYIDKSDLIALDQDMQIGGVPHGIPIAGIGGCKSGQSLCTKNPILSCYTCRKFLPISEAKVHQDVVSSLRPIVLEFANTSRNNEESPAYTQLRRMLEAALLVANEAHGIEATREGL